MIKNKIEIQVSIHFKTDDVGWIVRGDSIEPLSTSGITRPRHLRFIYAINELVAEYIKNNKDAGH